VKSYSFRELVKKLRKHDPRFRIDTRRGKGSHRMLVHTDIDGRKQAYPLVCHNEGAEISKVYLVAIRRNFKLPDDFFD